ncbi:hypothetical protein ADP71_17040 [Vitreoscilla sp. C1]|uniref:hypothetical protein n=1 Tax=Vitreoscilla sp. (strain C1) TaxID=96942 RepID=UPI000CDBEBE6|nr:hypothetical protein [Vitreoscilla sp. C1]AUZ05231.1 hypothetical protein ADP71_17040 [Vitreoscilla sp. C1]
MSRYVNLTYRNKNNELDNNNFRIFSLRGCYSIAFFAKTEVAKQFRKWVLDLIEQQMKNSQYHQVSVMQQYYTMQMLANLNLPDADEVPPYVH